MALNQKKNEMPSQAPDVRITNFEEVALGYTAEIAIAEAGRCLNCKNMPCVSGCPVNVRIPEFISHIKTGDFEDAYQVIAGTSSLPAVCGRVCPQESQCESKCTMGIKFEPVAIGRLERFAADYHNANTQTGTVRTEAVQAGAVQTKATAGDGVQAGAQGFAYVGAQIGEPGVTGTGNAGGAHRVAVIGSGPSGLTCAGDLIRKGHDVTVFEALHALGGVLMYGIPEFRLPKSIVEKEVNGLKAEGVKFVTNAIIGKTMTIGELFEEGFEAVYIGSGAGLPKFMNIEGESLKGVYSANEFLTRINLMRAYKDGSFTPVMKGGRVVVVGGGNVAMDAARTARRMGADVKLVYRRSMDELPARKEEVEHAIEEGIDFQVLTNPVRILGYNNPEDRRDPKNGFVTGVECISMELGEPDEKGRRKPSEVRGSEHVIDADTVIMALGTTPNPIFKKTTEGLEYTKNGGIAADEATGLTSLKGVFAGGDAVTGSATVIQAMGAGKIAAAAIDRYLTGAE